MRIREAGQITDDFYVMGHPDVPVYLFDGKDPVLFDAGFSVLGPLYIQEIKRVLVRREPRYLFFTHTHFDHIGSVAQFKKEWPALRVTGSPGAGKILSNPRAIDTIRNLNHDAALCIQSNAGQNNAGQSNAGCIPEGEPFEPFHIDLFVKTGQCFELSQGASVQAIPAPGHTRDFTAYWIPERKILIASEAAGCENGSNSITPEFLIDYGMYRRTLTALSRMGARVLCPGHRVVATGADVQSYFRQSLDEAADYVRRVKSFLQEENGDMEKTVARVKAHDWDGRAWPKQPEISYVLNTRERVKCIWKEMQGRSGAEQNDEEKRHNP